MRRRQWSWSPHGWSVLLTVGGPTWGFGFVACSYNGPDIFFGPVILSFQPPLPTHIEWHKTK
jgi:hypothetical protein